MTNARNSFFVTGGTLGHDAPCYVERRADSELYQALLDAEFCYVLTSRQMGKSSLMVRTAARLTSDGVHVVVLDLTMLGRNLSVEQWYYGLLGHAGEQLGLRKELREYWIQQPLLSPLQRWISALREIILPRCHGQLVIFIDEVDAVRSLPFSTDEFFAGIRECYNRRAQDPLFRKLAFCFLGVASPSDLMKDERTTPFNVGRRIELSDFSEDEAKPLAFGLALGDLGVLERPMQQARSLLQRVLHWTGGHPYLTQRLCLGVVSTPGVNSPNGVDEVCLNLFLSDAAREKDDNLIFVRDRMLRSDVEPSLLLDVYNRVLLGKRVRDHPSEPLYAVLHLAGIVREERGVLLPRNQIYNTVFDREWARSSAPEARLPDHRSEARLEHLRRFAAAATLIIGVLGIPAGVGFAVQHAQDHARDLRRGAYVSDLLRAQASYEAGSLERLEEPLARQQPGPREEDLRGFEWSYYWRLCHQALRSMSGTAPARLAQFTATGQQLLSLSPEGVSVWKMPEGTLQSTTAFPTPLPALLTGTPAALSRNTEMVALATAANEVSLFQRSSNRLIRLGTSDAPISALALSADGKTLVLGNSSSLEVWDVALRKLTRSLSVPRSKHRSLSINSSGSLIAEGGTDSTVRFWEARTGRLLGSRSWAGYPLEALTLSEDGTLVAAALQVTEPHDRPICRLELWSPSSSTPPRDYRVVEGNVSSLAISPSNGLLAVGTEQGILAFLSVKQRERPRRFLAHTGRVTSLTWSPDGMQLASSGVGGHIRIWDPAAAPGTTVIAAHSGPLSTLGFSPDGQELVTASAADPVRIWNTSTLRELRSLRAAPAPRAAYIAPSQVLVLDNLGGRIYDLDSNAQSDVADAPPEFQTAVLAPDALGLAMSDERSVRLWHPSERRFQTTAAGNGPVRGMALAAGGRLAAISRADGMIHLWDLHRAKEVGTVPSPGALVMAFSPDGRQLAIAADNSIRLRTLAGGERYLEGYGAGIRCLAFSPDGKTLASGDATSVIRLWNRASGKQVGELRSSLQGVTHLVFSPRGDTLAAAGGSGRIQVWRAGVLSETE